MPPLVDGEILVAEPGHQGGQDPLEAEAPAEVWMVDVIADDREEVHQTRDDTPQWCFEVRQGLRHFLNTSALEAGIVRNDGSGGFAGPDQALRKRRPRISGPVGEPFVMSDKTVSVLNVAAELGRHRIVGMATLPHGDGEAHGLEVEECDRGHEGVQRAGEGRLDDDPAFLHRPALPVRDLPQRHVLRQVVDRLVALLVELQGPAPHSVERAHVVGRQGRPAARHERALVGRRAVRPDGQVRNRPLEHCALLDDPPRHLLCDRAGRLRHVRSDEEVREVGVGAFAIEVHHLGADEMEPGPAQDVRLHGHVGDVVVLHGRGRLHLDEAEAAALALQDVHRHEYAVGAERALVDRRSARVDGLTGQGHALGVGVVGQLDRDPARHVAPRHLTHVAAPVHHGLRLGIERELRSLGLVHHPPEELVALKPGHHARLREAGGPRMRARSHLLGPRPALPARQPPEW